MSIYIPGMEMPKSCAGCDFCADGWCYVISADQEQPGELSSEKRPDWCPLVEVKPHGRLIDADELMDGWMNLREATKYGNKTKEQMNHSYSTMMMYEIADAIEDAETIIPADPAEEGPT